MKAYPTYKDSGTVWQGVVPSHWEKLRNKNELYPKVHHVGSNPNKLPMLSLTKKGVIVRDLETGKGKFSADESKFLIVEPGDFVFCHYDIQETPRTVGLSTHLGYITGSYNIYGYKGKNRRFFYYLHEYFDDAKLLCPLYKGLRNTIRQDRFLSMRIFLPPVEEQNAIVAYLDKKCAEIDELVTRRQAIIERLKELKQSIIAEAVTKGLNPDVPMKDSGIDWLGEVPQHWEKYRTPSILKVTSKAGTDSDELLSVYLDRGVIKHSESDGMQVHKPSKDMSAYQKVLPGNFVCNNQQAWRGSVGVSEHEGRISPAYIIFNLSSKLEPKFANYFFRSQAWNPSFVYSSKGVGSIQRNLYLPWLRQHYCYLPSTEEQQAIVTYLDKKCADIDELVARQEQIIEKLKELKTSTIAHVVTGKVDVRDAI